MDFMRFIWIFLPLWIAACTPLIPATTPPQLEHTPGAFVSIDGDHFDAGFFRVDYPDGWRTVKTSVAAAPLEVVFASPDNSMTIHIVEGDAPFPEATPDPAIYERWEWIHLSSDMTITVIGEAPIEAKDEFDVIFDGVVQSVNS